MAASSEARSGSKLALSNLNPNLLKAEYAVRGAIVARAAELEKQLESRTAKLPFEKLVYCNIGNPQALGQEPITFNRQVGVLCDYPALRSLVPPGTFPDDVMERAKTILEGHPSTGAYSNSKGVPVCRKLVAAGIEERDGFPCDPESLYMTNGASSAVHGLLELMIRGPEDGWLVPVPQYPLYSAGITMSGGSLVPYYLDEANGWALDIESLDQAVTKARRDGIQTRAMVVINPGNPTGQCLSKENLKAVIQFCVTNNLVLIADEVYQANVYAESKEFHSFKKVMCEMGPKASGLQLASLHSISKGFTGECGRRGGYMEIVGFAPEVIQQLVKLRSVNLCPNLSGQISMANMMQPPKPGHPSYALYARERDDILSSLKRRAAKLYAALNQLEGVTCQPAEGAMYAFPSISLPPAAIREAREAGKAPDFLYCMQCLEATGLVIVPGSGFWQKEGTYHFRITFLPSEQDIADVIKHLADFHRDFMKRYTSES